MEAVKFYSNKSNAKRAAVKQGLDLANCELKQSEGGFAYVMKQNDEVEEVTVNANSPFGSLVGQLLGTTKNSEKGAKTPATKRAVSGNKFEKDRPEQNGIKRPSAGGLCRAVWDECDAFLAANGRSPSAKEMKEIAAEKGWNKNNASIELYQWRKFNGMGK